MSWQTPVEPVVGRIYTDALLAQDHSKPHAFDTMFRYSSVLRCARALAYDAAGLEQSDPMDGPSLGIAQMGSLLHEDIGNAIVAAEPDALCEVGSRIGDLISGSCDIDRPSADEVVEMKTVGAFKFDQAVGLRRVKNWQGPRGRIPPAGPTQAHVVQGAMNAWALHRANVRIVYISREAISINLAEQTGFPSIERFVAEWLIPRFVWEPMVEAELARLRDLEATVASGYAPGRWWINDDGKEVEIANTEITWPCGYCPHRHRCRMDGEGRVELRKKAS